MNRVKISTLLIAAIWAIAVISHACSQAVAAELSPKPTPAVKQPSAPAEPVRLMSKWSVDRARPGDRIFLAIVFDIKKGFHINADKAQLQPMASFKPFPTRIVVMKATDGLTFESARFPKAHATKVSFDPNDLMTFSGRTAVFLPIQLADNTEGHTMAFQVEVSYQACDRQVCLFPRKVALQVTLPVVAPGEDVSEVNPALFAKFRESTREMADTVRFDLFGWRFTVDITTGWGYGLLLVTAAIGGLLLNFTPCVLPLIPIKIISLSNAAHNQARCLSLGLSMTLGILAFWLGLGSAIALFSGFTTTSQLFQYPLITIGIGIVIVVMALGLFGQFSVRLPRFVYLINPNQETLLGAFILGILTAILSTPCTAPFMGAAAAWAATRTPLTTLATFVAIGAGMASPYLVLSARPVLIQHVPRSGPAGILIKEMMGLLILAAGAYFIGTGISSILMAPPNPPSRHYWWVVMGLIASSGVWLTIRCLRLAGPKKMKIPFVVLGVLIAVGSIFGAFRLTSKGPIDWVYYTPERYQTARLQRKVVLMVFTAEWCLNCKALEQSVLLHPSITRLLAHDDIVPMKVDITGNNPLGRSRLKAVGTLTIPLAVVYAPTGREMFKGDYYTIEQITSAINAARAASEN